MLLESIKLHNFRQFRDESIEFAQGKNKKNVTIIIGDNGTGKTTFAQAFFWCMYGNTSFKDKKMLNKIVAKEMLPGQEEKVRVTLTLRHGAVGYTLIREQVYKKDFNNKIKDDNTVFTIAKKDASGNTTYIKPLQCEAEVKSILPEELSKYFFFDGERIEKMSKDLSDGKKATDFEDAVKGLLGLNGYISAIAHFNPNSSKSVIGSYDSSFDAKSNIKISEYTAIINRCNKEIAELEAKLENLDAQIESAKQRKAEKTEEIKQYADGEELQNQRERLEREIKNIESSRSNVYKSICKDFNSSMSSFFSISLMKRSLDLLANEDFMGKDIPFMHTKTIEYKKKQKTCICGTHLDKGTVPYDKVMELVNYLPPQSISTTVSDFKKEARRRAGNNENIVSQVRDNLSVISSQSDEITEKMDDIRRIEKKLSGGDVREKVRAINAEIQICDNTIRKSENDIKNYNRDIGGKITERDRADAERRNLTLLDDRNRKIEIYKAYAEQIYQELFSEYLTSESEIRNKLQDTINNIFKELYDGGLCLTIDEKYHITVYSDFFSDEDTTTEASTAQSIAVIFAFITGIIKMARDNRNSSDSDTQLLSSEPYPLVMDAPLSAFDKKRIKTVCESIPKTAEQVIIFIKDTDGELAEEYLGNRIGSRHRFEKINEFETVLN